MSYLIRCYTLFDITETGIRQRNCPVNTDLKMWTLQRNQQCNFDTLIQTISIRSLPEITGKPRIQKLNKHKFGTKFKRTIKAWLFEFTVADISMWHNNSDNLYHLKHDCEGVPMIICGDEVTNLDRSLFTDLEKTNIYFEVIDHGE